MTEVDRLNLLDLVNKNPSCSIVFDNGLLDGTEEKPFGFVPNSPNGITLYFTYRKDNGRTVNLYD